MSSSTNARGVSDDEIQSVIDCALPPERHAEIVARIAEDPDLLAEVESQIALNEALKEEAALLTATVGDPETEPERTRILRETLAERLTDSIAVTSHRMRGRFFPPARSGIAAAILLATGWFGHLAYDYATSPYPSYVAEAVGAHLVFAEDRHYPTEFRAEDMTHAMTWFAEKIGRDIPPPQLDAIGLQLVGARLLGSKEGPLAQYIYEDAAGERLSLVVKEAMDAASLVPAYRDLPEGRASYWRDGGFEYALVSQYDDLDRHASVTEVSRALLAQRI
jgi:anti-sigma factor RsiW